MSSEFGKVMREMFGAFSQLGSSVSMALWLAGHQESRAVVSKEIDRRAELFGSMPAAVESVMRDLRSGAWNPSPKSGSSESPIRCPGGRS